MTPKIKEQMEQIRRGAVPEGYTNQEFNIFPLGWSISKLGKLFKERVEIRRTDLPLLAITGTKGVVPRSELDMKDNSSNDKSKYLRVCVGDIGYNTMSM